LHTPSFVLLVQTRSTSDAESLLKDLRARPNPICSLDTLNFEFFHSFSFDAEGSNHLVSHFLQECYSDSNCAICLNPCTRDHPLFVFPCDHALHMKCAARMAQWECPICRYAPIASLDVACCQVCGSFDRPFVCLCCSRSFCNDHCREHYVQTGHAYCASADGRETWNLMSGSYMRRIAYDKSGEFVEMCAKEEQLRGYLEATIDEQVEIHKAIAAQRLKTERDALEQKRQRLRNAVAEKMARINTMRGRIGEQGGKVKRLAAAKKLLEFFKQRAIAAEREINERRAAVARLEADVENQAALVQDMERTVCISGSAALAGRSGKVHIKFGPP
jgi:hypothetical protein